MNELLKNYLPDLQRNFDRWMEENEYKKVEMNPEVIADLLDEFLSFLASPSDFAFVMDEVDKDQMLGEYDWCEREEE